MIISSNALYRRSQSRKPRIAVVISRSTVGPPRALMSMKVWSITSGETGNMGENRLAEQLHHPLVEVLGAAGNHLVGDLDEPPGAQHHDQQGHQHE